MDIATPHAWFYAATTAMSLSIACVAFALARGAVAPEPRLGLRGLKRQKALRKRGNFARVEPAVRKVAGWVAALELGGLRRRADALLLSAGDYLGLSADELVALVILGAGGGAAFAALWVALLGFSPVLIPLFAVGAGYLVVADVRAAADVRRRDVSRSLPSAIDLIALCMSAGLDFSGALVQIVKNAPLEDDPLIEELGLILYHLQLGHSRSRALQVFGSRVPTESVSDFVFAVVQAEAKGNPLAETLRTQASVLRTRRSVRAEELAAKAANKMLIPMTLLVACALFLILGPMLVKMLGSGVF
ncbi:MAG TPA: type II secretion system F family protein [Kofleriaceae bacterium]|nr:type II secretion system F family protein [Kofleriaceae bacterium]